HARTLAGLGGVGSLFVTAHGVESPDYELGLAIAHGPDVATAMASVGRTSEAPSVARYVARVAAEKRIRATLFGAIAEILDGRRTPGELTRDFFVAAPTEM